MKAEDKHRWKPIKDHLNIIYHKCEDCECIRYKNRYGYIYARSGIFFGSRPNCIKEEIESKKTID